MEDFDADNPHSWRSLQKQGARRAAAMSTPVARQRRTRAFFKTVFWLWLIVGILAAAVWGMHYLRDNPQTLGLGKPLQPVRTIQFATNGVMAREWVEQFIGFTGQGNVEPDVRALQRKLEGTGQVRKASLERVWPDILKINLVEEEPVARLVASQPGGIKKLFLVSRRGVVYEGVGYAQATVNALPFLDGVVIRRLSDGSYEPIPGMEVVANLLSEASLRLPNLRAQWTVVSLEDFEGNVNLPWAVIRVKSTNLGEIIFAPRDFPRQLDNLATAVNDFASKNQKVKRIDLSIDGLGVAQFVDPPKLPPQKPTYATDPVDTRKKADANTPVQLLPGRR